MDFSQDKALSMIMGIPQEQRKAVIELAVELAGMEEDERELLWKAVEWIETYSVPQQPSVRKRGRPVGSRSRARQVGSVTNAAEA